MGETKTVYIFYVVEVSFENLNPERKDVTLLLLLNTIKSSKMNQNLTKFHPVIIIATQYWQIFALPPAQEFTNTYLLLYLFTYLLTNLFTYLRTYLFTYLFIYLLIYLFTYLLI